MIPQRPLLLAALALGLLLPATPATAQQDTTTAVTITGAYEPSPAYPFGRLNPNAPPETEQFAFMLGAFDCTDRIFNQQNGTWKEVKKLWNGRSFLNGYAIRDDTWRSDGVYTSNIRKYDAQGGKWVVSYFSDTGAAPSVWEGGLEDGIMTVRQDGESPQGPFTARLAFHDVSDDGFEWKMHILAGGQVLPWWTSSCKRLQ